MVAGALVSVEGAVVRSQSAFRAGTTLVAVYATVQDATGRLVAGVPRNAFTVLDDGTRVEVAAFSNERQPLTVALLLDMSASIAGEFARVKGAAEQFVERMAPGDRVRIGTFGAEIALSPWLTGDHDRLRKVLAQELWPGGETPLYAAMDAAMVSLSGEAGRRVVLVITDGADSSMIERGRDLRAVVQQHAVAGDFMVYAIGLEGPGLDRSLATLAEQTGGARFQLSRNAELQATMARVIEEIRHQYLLGFVPARLDGRTHRIEVRVSTPGLRVRARRSYVAGVDR